MVYKNISDVQLSIEVPYLLPDIGPYDETRIFKNEGTGSILSFDERNTTTESTEV